MSRTISSKARFFDRLAAGDLWLDFSPQERRCIARLLRRLRIAPGMTVLEPGCGKGRLTGELLRAVGPHGRVIANDISPRMIAAARRRRLGRRVRWCVGPAAALCLPRASVDRIVCFHSFPHLGSPRLILKKFRKMLKPDGLLAIVHLTSRREVNRVHAHAAAAIRRDLLPDARTMRNLLRQCGFGSCELRSTRTGYWLFATAAPEKPLGAMDSGRAATPKNPRR